jgi:hypothetical protein
MTNSLVPSSANEKRVIVRIDETISYGSIVVDVQVMYSMEIQIHVQRKIQKN